MDDPGRFGVFVKIIVEMFPDELEDEIPYRRSFRAHVL